MTTQSGVDSNPVFFDKMERAKKTIANISILLLLILLFSLYNQYNFLLFLISDSVKLNIQSVILLFSLSLLAVSIILFRLKFKVGWFAVSTWLLYQLLNALIGFLFAQLKSFDVVDKVDNVKLLSNDFYLSAILIYGGFFVLIHRSGIIEVFGIVYKLKMISYSMAVIAVIYFSYPLFLIE